MDATKGIEPVEIDDIIDFERVSKGLFRLTHKDGTTEERSISRSDFAKLNIRKIHQDRALKEFDARLLSGSPTVSADLKAGEIEPATFQSKIKQTAPAWRPVSNFAAFNADPSKHYRWVNKDAVRINELLFSGYSFTNREAVGFPDMSQYGATGATSSVEMGTQVLMEISKEGRKLRDEMYSKRIPQLANSVKSFQSSVRNIASSLGEGEKLTDGFLSTSTGVETIRI